MIDPTKFGVPVSVTEAYEKMSLSWNRETDTIPLPVLCGFNKTLPTEVKEVYQKFYHEVMIPEHEQENIHSALFVPHVHDAVRHYSTTSSFINDSLWNNYLHSSEIDEEALEHVKHIDRALKPETRIPGARLLTGFHESPITKAGLQWNSTRPKKLLILPAFTSTTTDLDTAARFTVPDTHSVHHESDHHGAVESGARHILDVHFGDRPIYNALSVRDHSTNPGEKEVILGRGHELILHPRPTKISHPDLSHPVYVWKAEPSTLFKPFQPNSQRDPIYRK